MVTYAREFPYEGTYLPLYDNMYNSTSFNERGIELTLAYSWLNSRCHKDNTLEVGNVLAHYEDLHSLAPHRDVLDLYEKHPAVTWNLDFFDWIRDHGDYRYDNIIAISTLEHFGVDDGTDDPGRAIKALERMIGLLKPDGSLFVTFPSGHNDALDDALMMNADPINKAAVRVWTRTSGRDFIGWVEADPNIHDGFYPVDYGITTPWAEQVTVMEITR